MILKRGKGVTCYKLAHQTTDRSFLNPDQLPFWVTAPSPHTGQDILRCENPFGQFRSLVPDVLPPGFFCIPPHWQSMRPKIP